MTLGVRHRTKGCVRNEDIDKREGFAHLVGDSTGNLYLSGALGEACEGHANQESRK